MPEKIENIEVKAKPFIKWVGGKTQLLESVEKVLQPGFSKIEGLTYIEPFVGGGAVLFWILQRFPNITRAVINDINPDLTTAYQVVKECPSDLIEQLKKIESEFLPTNEETRKQYFLEKRAIFNNEKLGSIEKTAVLIFLNRTCFNGLYRVNSRGFFNVPFGRYSNPKICDEKTILADSRLLQKVEILTGDFEKTLDYAASNSFFYFDPPYKPLNKTSAFKSYAKNDFNDAEQIRLAEFCKKTDALGHYFLLSNSDVQSQNPDDVFFDDLYREFSISKVFASRMVNAVAGKRGKLTELMITNLNRKTF